MTKPELENTLKELRQEYELKVKETMKQFCDANNKYMVGDKFTDHIGTILIEKINYSYTTQNPSCVYFGIELKKNGTPKKSQVKRSAWQVNDISVIPY
jgi:hypothetical protein